jgi:hypothetical protein
MQPRGSLSSYDCALIHVPWRLKLKQASQICVISCCVESMRPVHELPRVWDRIDPRNAVVLADEIINLTNLGQLRMVRYQNPDIHQIHTFLTSEYTLPLAIRPRPCPGPGPLSIRFR